MQIPITYEDVISLQLFFNGLALNLKVNLTASLSHKSWTFVKDLVAFREVYDLLTDLENDLPSLLFYYIRRTGRRLPSMLTDRELIEHMQIALQLAADYLGGATHLFNNSHYQDDHIKSYFKIINALIKEIQATYTPIEYMKICDQSL